MAMFNVLRRVSRVSNENKMETNGDDSVVLEDIIKTLFQSAKVNVFAASVNSELYEIIHLLKSSGVRSFRKCSFDEVISKALAEQQSNKQSAENGSINHDEEQSADGPNVSAKEEGPPRCNIVDFSDSHSNRKEEFVDQVLRYSCRQSFPLVFIKGDCIGGIGALRSLLNKGFLSEYYKDHDYDLVVIGGGSGGLAAAKRAAEKGKKVAVLDFVKPTPIGTTWGLGGTCVNVGCIPKKLMHQAAILGKSLEDARKFGWQFGTEVTTDWKTLTTNIKNHILSLNYGYKVALRQKSCTYINGYGSFINSHTIKAVQKDGKEVLVTADRFLIATGLRPRYLDIPGAKEYCVTSDDLFTLPYPPGKTLVVGASYVSLECAGFLHGYGFDVTVMVRSILLRGFDQDMAERIGKHMEEHGVKFVGKAIPTKIERLEEGQPGLYKVTYTQQTPEGETELNGEFNTILLAIGRDAVTDDVNLDLINVARNKSKKIVCFDNEQSITTPHVYAIGDVSEGRPELTPAAIQGGRCLADRLYDINFDLFDYKNVPTTVFTPLEYGCCGLSEEDAKEKYGEKAVVYHSMFTPLEYTVPKRKSDMDSCYAKVLFHGDIGKPKNLEIVGLHYLGPNAGEVTQGFGLALKFKAKMSDLTSLVGIHPTTAEVFTFSSMVLKTEAPLQATGC